MRPYPGGARERDDNMAPRNGGTPAATKKLPRVLDQPDSDMWLTIEPPLLRMVELYRAELREQQRDTLSEYRHPLEVVERFLAQCARMLPTAAEVEKAEQESG